MPVVNPKPLPDGPNFKFDSVFVTYCGEETYQFDHEFHQLYYPDYHSYFFKHSEKTLLFQRNFVTQIRDKRDISIPGVHLTP